MQYLKLDATIPHPYRAPVWLPGPENATPFPSEGAAKAMKSLIPNASGVLYDDKEEYWYVVKVVDPIQP